MELRLSELLITRREAIAALVSAMPLVYGCARQNTPGESTANSDANAVALLDSIAENLLRLNPETATSLGIDTGARAALRSELVDRSAEGTKKFADQVRADLEKAKALDTSGLTFATRSSL